MARVYYVTCPVCEKEYYLDQTLYKTSLSNPKQKLKCPFCKEVFLAERGAIADKTG